MAKKKKLEAEALPVTTLATLAPAKGATKERKRVGRGPGSGRGGTSTRGHKGAQSRTGYSAKVGFEGGQMPLYRRLPKFGFKNPFRIEFTEVNLDRLTAALEKHPELAKATITPEALHAAGVVRSLRKPVKLLGRGEIKAKLTVQLHGCSASAKAAIEAAGGTVLLLEPPAAEATTTEA
ncbi:MAG: 50S ribosomal protein L15 [Bacteroidia bacterium]|nr:50S ribosomal protein L15 [Bacteroidia bacterium]